MWNKIVCDFGTFFFHFVDALESHENELIKIHLIEFNPIVEQLSFRFGFEMSK